MNQQSLKVALQKLRDHTVSMDSTMCALLTILDIAEALKFLHRNNILHGDLKPQNILLCTAKTVRPLPNRVLWLRAQRRALEGHRGSHQVVGYLGVQ
jgi:hypothetical protein